MSTQILKVERIFWFINFVTFVSAIAVLYPHPASESVGMKLDYITDALLHSALTNANDQLASPLSTPPSSRSCSPQPTNSNVYHTGPVQISPPVEDTQIHSKRKRRRKKPVTGNERVDAVDSQLTKKSRIKNVPDDKETREQQRSHRNRARKRKDVLSTMFSNSNALPALAAAHTTRHVGSAVEAQDSDGNGQNNVPAGDLRSKAASTGYIGNPRCSLPEQREYRLEELVDDGVNDFALIKHKEDVTQYISCPVTDKIFAIAVPGPSDRTAWMNNSEVAATFIKEKRPECRFPEVGTSRRGQVHNINYGISFGNGQPKPMILNDQGPRRKAVMEEIRRHEAFQRIARWMSTIFLTWAPLLFEYYSTTMSALLLEYPELELPFAGVVFAAFTVNFGPKTVCLPHRDSKNLAFGWCAITALGNFDYTKGGHLVLWDLKMVIEFPPGSTILLPSALICHFNTAIGPEEERFSFTCYSAGGIFRWVDHGFQTETSYGKTDEAKQNSELDRTRWERGVGYFSTIQDLISRVKTRQR
ncbi:hypothetical protein AAF712_008532 [Marasmius tenuissimus]|uniref:Uncharacterized protein n=1 Tax=Marasmius tenuissimus TaxID=585030 RepID=A0ABR2ZWC4_9AGAR